MMQSYKHFSVLPDPSFMELKVAIDECGRYKRIVGDVSKYTDIRHYDEQLFISIAAHHLRKANYLLVGDYVVPSMEGFLSWDYSKLFRIQLNHVEFRKFVYVLNTCIFILIENNPIKFWHYIEDTCGSYLI